MPENVDFPKITYILGAGCSVEDDVSLVNNFFQLAFKKIEPLLQDSQKERFKKIREYRDEILPGANIEQLFSYIDLMRSLYSNDTPKYNELNQLRNDLFYLIVKTIGKNIIERRSVNYKNFLRNHIEKNKNPTYINPIISFNWELLLDNIIFNPGIYRIADIIPVDYGANFKMIDDNGEPRDVVRSSSYKVLKLHGSLNWLYCEQCRTRFFVFGEKITIPIWEGHAKSCPNCEKPLNPIIVPPTFQKFDSKTGISLLNEI